MTPVDYMALPAAAGLFAHARVYAKRETTALRLPTPAEIGSLLSAYKADPAHELGYSLEVSTPIASDSAIARNSNVKLGQGADGAPIYNEWPISLAMVEKNYGSAALSSLRDDFQEFRKKATVRAVELDEGALALLGAEPGGPLMIKVSWSPNPMSAALGDFITDQGYAIAAANMKDYELVACG